MFKKKNDSQQVAPADPAAEPTAAFCENEIERCQHRLEECEKATADSSAKARAAHEAVEHAQAVLRGARTQHDLAAFAHSQQASDANATAVQKAKAAVEAAERQLLDLSKFAGDADAAVQASDCTACEAREALDAAFRTKQLVELRAAISVDTMNARTLKPAQRILDLRRQMLEAAAEIDRAFLESTEAAAALRAMGEDCPDPGGHHLIAHFITARVAEDPTRTEALIKALDQVSQSLMPVGPRGARIGECLQSAIMSSTLLSDIWTIRGVDTPPERQQDARADLAAGLQGRTRADAYDAVEQRRSDRRKLREKKFLEGYTPPTAHIHG